MKEVLFALQDIKYRDFQRKLIPTINPEKILGVRTPDLRALAKKIAGTPQAAAFLAQLPHTFYEEDNLHAFLLERIQDFDEAVHAVDTFLPYVDNWATCDQMSPKVFAKQLPRLIRPIKGWIADNHVYTVRYGIGLLMKYYLTDSNAPWAMEMVAQIQRDEYYIKMMIAWFFATALAKQYQRALPYLEQRRLPVWTHNKAIQKAIESARILPEQKAALRRLAIKESRL
jgi:predicted DNA alkylation repair enzyme